MAHELECPHCGALLPANARFCRHCGADDEVGWADDADEGYAADDDFDYDDFVRREFPDEPPPNSRNTFYVTVVVLLILAFTLAVVF